MKAAHHRIQATTPTNEDIDWFDLFSPVDDIDSLQPGEMFHMDFGFPRGQNFQTKDEYGRLITSIDGHRAYLLIIDRKTRYIWVAITKNKMPPCAAVTKFLDVHGRKTGRRVLRTDQGGELWGSLKFREAIHQAGYLMEPTAPGAPFQNGLAERPNQTLGNIMRCMLHGANLGPQFWPFALTHAVRIYNMLPHSVTKQTPLYSLTGIHPTTEWLRIFGCRYYARKKGDRPHKLDYNTSTGIFLGFTGTAKNVYYYDLDSKRIKTSTHGIFDEANITIPQAERSTASQALIDLGYKQDQDTIEHETPTNTQPIAQIQLRSPHARIPTQGSARAAGYDVYSTTDCDIKPQTIQKVPLHFTIIPPQGTYIQLHSRSGLASKGVIVYAGVIDPDFRGDITVLLFNSSQSTHSIKRGDRIAQLVFHNIATPVILQEQTLEPTDRAEGGFGSTDHPALAPDADTTPPTIRQTAPEILQPREMPYNIFLSTDPFDDVITIMVKDFGAHETMGMALEQCAHRNRPRLRDIIPSQPCSRIKNWRSTIKHGYIIQIEEHIITTIADVKAAIQQSRELKLESIQLQIALDIKPSGLHPTEGIPQLFADQLQTIHNHIQDIKAQNHQLPAIYHVSTRGQTGQTPDAQTPDANWQTSSQGNTVNPQTEASAQDTIHHTLHRQFMVVQQPVLRQLLDADYPSSETDSPPPQTTHPEGTRYTYSKIKNDPEWMQACYQQLDQYEDQDMFDKPQPKPADANAWPLIWTFLLKPDRKKARCVVDASKRWRRTMKIGETFANSLATDSERLFWAIAAKRGLVVVGADVSNAFAEAPAPGNTFYIIPDQIFHQWWTEHKKRPPIPKGWVLRVKYALQGHPESPRLWEQHIKRILTTKIGYKPMHHEPCLYQATIADSWTMLLRQVDDFAFAVETEEIGKSIVTAIDQHLRIRIKYLGVLTMFNGMDITQTQYYIKIHCTTYLNKIIHQHNWQESTHKPYQIPYPADNTYCKILDTALPPDTVQSQKQLSKHYNMHYRQIIGEFIWPMIKCRPDISFHITKLSQFMANPAEAHYQALRHVASYLANTTDHGIYYWRDQPRQDLPQHPLPTTFPDTYRYKTDPTNSENFLTAYADSDWGTCRKTRNAITGAAILVAGGVVGYKTKFQHAIALSSTEAEWVAACDTGRMILYYRALLDDLGIPQHQATIMFEDNRGALFMANAQQPSNRTRHIDIKTFALTDWVEQDLMLLMDILTSENCADHLTKALPKTLFYRHTDTLMGRRVPHHITEHLTQLELDQAIRMLTTMSPMHALRCTHAKTTGG